MRCPDEFDEAQHREQIQWVFTLQQIRDDGVIVQDAEGLVYRLSMHPGTEWLLIQPVHGRPWER